MATTYQHHVLCDNCGRSVRREPIDAAQFDKLVKKSEPDEDDLFEEAQERPVQVVVTHVPVCSHCQERT